MGKNNRSRRARKRRREDARRRDRKPPTDADDRRRETPPLGHDQQLLGAAYAHRRDDGDVRDVFISALLEQPPVQVGGEVARLLRRIVSNMWERGWQPVDLTRLVAKRLGRGEADLLRRAIAAEAVDYQQWGTAVAPDWMAQLEEIGAAPTSNPSRPWPLQCSAAWSTVLMSAVTLIAFVDGLPDLPRLAPPPSRWPVTSAAKTRQATRLEPGVLARIRALLAKAESTEYDAEAEAFTAKAQEMMTRHRIDRTSLSAEEGLSNGGVIGRRVGVDDPYARAKAMLVAGIAHANACRAVWSKEFGFATIHGHPEDVDGVEELYTSLLVQATSALQREGSKQDRFGRSRTARFRRSFLVGFAVRIGERLEQADYETVRRAERETGVAIVPLLASRARAAEEAMNAIHGRMQRMSVSVSDGEGYAVGTRVADQADLTLRSDGELAGSPSHRLG